MHRHRMVVRHEHDRHAPPREGVEDVQDLRPGLRVEISRGLVGQDDRGVGDEGAGDGHALALAARELAGLVIRAMGQTHGLEGRDCRFPRRPSLVVKRQLHVLERARAREEIIGLKNEPDPQPAHAGELVIVERAHVLALEEVAAARGNVEAAQDIHQGGLARARGPHEGDILALLDIKVDALEDGDVHLAQMVVLDDVLGADDAHGLRR